MHIFTTYKGWFLAGGIAWLAMFAFAIALCKAARRGDDNGQRAWNEMMAERRARCDHWNREGNGL